ncbi:unnamed protein product [Vitrella brassicaformis CCMP3155]|uniref:Cation/H+ exchanger transmembrane domain-containing protein n=3 Tax=Vitrella brassicaformis TaxID=1169539 RepID=A0A0G4H3Q2_VITBC|nr:unnamed protein product [Vitrella brassicaformis CCMP3155]|eukprot:CEM38358.1 unnamed protein product [Vitrella brassicaformis CCMP3155]
MSSEAHGADVAAAEGSVGHGEEDELGERIEGALAFLIFTFLISSFIQWVITLIPRFRPPVSVTLFVAGMLLSWWSHNMDLSLLGVGIKDVETIHPHFILLVLLPILLYESASNVNWHVFKRVLPSSVLLAIVGVILNIFIIGPLMYVIFPNTSTGGAAMGWDVCLMLASVLSATDPVAVVAALHELAAPAKLASIIDGESLLNDGSSFVLFLVFRKLAVERVDTVTGGDATIFFMKLAIGGPLWGMAVALAVDCWLRWFFTQFVIEITAVLAGAYLSYFVAETALGVSGVLAVVTYGLFFAAVGKYNMAKEVQDIHRALVEELSALANQVLFVIAGIITCRMLRVADSSFLYSAGPYIDLVLLYVFLHISRAAIVLLFSPILQRLGYGLSWKEGTILVYGGLRGAIAMALGLMVEEDTRLPRDVRDRVTFYIAGIVFLTLLINGTTVGWLYQRLRIYPPNPFRVVYWRKIVHHIEKEYKEQLQVLSTHWCFRSNPALELANKMVPDLTTAHVLPESGKISVKRVAVSSVLTPTAMPPLSQWKLPEPDEHQSEDYVLSLVPKLRERPAHRNVLSNKDKHKDTPHTPPAATPDTHEKTPPPQREGEEAISVNIKDLQKMNLPLPGPVNGGGSGGGLLRSSTAIGNSDKKAWQTPTSSPQPSPRHLLHRSQTAVGNEAEELLRQQQQRVTLQLLRRRSSLARGLGLHSRPTSMSTRQGTFLPSSFLVTSTDEGGVGAAGMSVDKADGKAAAVDGEESDEYDDQMRHITRESSGLPVPHAHFHPPPHRQSPPLSHRSLGDEEGAAGMSGMMSEGDDTASIGTESLYGFGAQVSGLRLDAPPDQQKAPAHTQTGRLEREGEIYHIFFNACREMYGKLFERGGVDGGALHTLMEALGTALDAANCELSSLSIRGFWEEVKKFPYSAHDRRMIQHWETAQMEQESSSPRVTPFLSPSKPKLLPTPFEVEWRTIESRLGTLSPSCVSRVPVPLLRGLGLYWRLMQDIETIMGYGAVHRELLQLGQEDLVKIMGKRLVRNLHEQLAAAQICMGRLKDARPRLFPYAFTVVTAKILVNIKMQIVHEMTETGLLLEGDCHTLTEAADVQLFALSQFTPLFAMATGVATHLRQHGQGNKGDKPGDNGDNGAGGGGSRSEGDRDGAGG